MRDAHVMNETQLVRKAVENLMRAADCGQFNDLVDAISNFPKKDLTIGDLLEFVKDSNGKTAFHVSCLGSSLEKVTWMLGNNSNLVNVEDHDKRTPLFYAATGGNIAIAATLLNAGANINAVAIEGRTAIAEAIHFNHCSMVEYLIDHGADLNVQTQAGTPIHWAAGVGFPDITLLLINRGVQLNIRDSRGLTPLVLACAVCGAFNDRGQDTVCTLLSHGADPALCTVDGVTIVHMLAESNSVRALEVLLQLFPEVDTSSTVDGLTAIECAAMAEFREVVEILSRFTAFTPVWTSDMIERRNVTSDNNIDNLMEWGRIKKDIMLASKSLSSVDAGVVVVSQEDALEAEASKEMGNKKHKNGDISGAIECYTRAIELDPTNGVYFSNRSLCYMSCRQFEHGLKDALDCKRLRKDWPKAYFRLSSAYLALQDFQMAAEESLNGISACSKNDSPESYKCIKDLKELFDEAIRRGKLK